MSLLDRIAYRSAYELGHLALRAPKRRDWVRYGEGDLEQVEADLKAAGLPVEPLRLDPEDYRAYLARADYARFPDYFAWGKPFFTEKSLEHYIAHRLLGLGEGEVYIDVANDASPTPEIYAELHGVTPYRQDLAFPEGIEGNRIGGDAAAMPVDDGFADAMALHCSFEHFEGDCDIRFAAEIQRVLRPGGRVCIVPLYLFTTYAVMTDPGVLGLRDRPPFDDEATIYSARHYRNRHGRFYDAAHLRSRFLDRLGSLKPALYRIENAKEVDPSCYVEFALLIEKPAA